MAKSNKPFQYMAWSSDDQVRAIHSEVDDRPLDEIADSVMEVHWNYDRAFQPAKKTQHLDKEEALEASLLASRIVDWANFANAYGDYSDPPWEEMDLDLRSKIITNPRRKKKPTTRRKAKKNPSKVSVRSLVSKALK